MKNFCKKLFLLTFASMTTVCAERVLKIVEVDQDLIRLENGSFISISSDGGHNLEVEDLLEFEDSSFDAIIVTAAPPTIPKHLKKLLKINGRLIIPVGDGLYQQELLRITSHENDNFTEERLLGVKFVPMVNS